MMKRKLCTTDEERNTDRRHTNKPYTKEMWDKYSYEYFTFTTKERQRMYGVSKRTIYRWNAEMKARWTDENQHWMRNAKI